MLSPRLTECTECSNISELLDIIDCKLTELAKNEYNNIIFSLNLPIQSETFGDLLNYKRILTNKLCNYDYACAFSLSAIASRVKVLTGGLTNCCVRKKAKPSHYIPIVPPTTTSTSSTSTSTTTTTTTCNPECNQVLLANTDSIYVLDVCTGNYSVITNLEYSSISKLGIANSENKLWTIDSDDYTCTIKEWNITYLPFTLSATPTSTWTGSLSSDMTNGMCSTSNPTKFISFNWETKYFCEIDISTPGTYTVTDKFIINNLDLVPLNSFVYTTGGDLIVLSTDNNNGDIYLTVYNYSTGAVITNFKINEFDGSYQFGLGLFTASCDVDCNCKVYILLNDDDGQTLVYYVDVNTHEVILSGEVFPLISIDPIELVGQYGASQLYSCAKCSIGQI